MKIKKSTRHAKIAGDFGEVLILYWLSKYGFECASVDHTGIDIIARNPHTQEIMGVSVKSRTRTEGAEEEYVSIPNENFAKAEAACKAFGCLPYFAIVVDAGDTVRGFLLPMSHLLELFPKGKTAACEGGRWFKRKFLLTMDLERYSFGSCQDSRDWMRLGHCIM
jgi:Holliday junction resolvase-like predicted endonuclease